MPPKVCHPRLEVKSGDQLKKSEDKIITTRPNKLPVGLCMILCLFEMARIFFVVRQVIQATAAWR